MEFVAGGCKGNTCFIYRKGLSCAAPVCIAYALAYGLAGCLEYSVAYKVVVVPVMKLIAALTAFVFNVAYHSNSDLVIRRYGVFSKGKLFA